MDDILNEERFDYLSPVDKSFILAFNDEMARLGYNFGDQIGSGYCWGKHMIIYRKSGVKSQNVYARIYMRDTDIALRLFLNGVDKHRKFIENAPAHIKEVFTGKVGDCRHCRDEKEEVCRFRKSYTIDDRFIEKCNGETFEFHQPKVDGLGDYFSLFTEFFPKRKG